MFGAFIRTLIAILLLALCYYLLVWVLGVIGLALPYAILLIIRALFILVGVMIIYRFWAPHLSGVNWWGSPPP